MDACSERTRETSLMRQQGVRTRYRELGVGWSALGRGGCLFEEPAGAVAAHVLNQRHQRLALLGQRILDPRRNLGEGVALDDPLLFQSPQAQRERARADPLQRALQLAESA